MKSFLVLSSLLIGISAIAHEGGHGTPEDPIANLPKITDSKGQTIGVEAMIHGNQAAILLRTSSNAVIAPEAAGLPKSAKGAIKFKGAAKWTEFPMTVSAKGAYEGTFKGKGQAPQLKFSVEGGKGGKKQSVIIEEVEQSASEVGMPHSHGNSEPHSHSH